MAKLLSDLFTPHRGAGPIKHYHWIDVFRGIAALSIIVWHYQHFYWTTLDVRSPGFSRSEQPFYDVLWIFYELGHNAVLFFWIISGFVFANVYANSKSSTRQFVVNRFARLYPLHFVTLIVVALLQYVSWQQIGRFQVFSTNDIYHFVLNLFFVSHWGLQTGSSFNVPIWSVSVEIFIYGVFWCLLPVMFRWGILGSAALITVFISLIALQVPGLFWLCGFYFFAGVAVFLLQEKLKSRPLLLVLLGTVGFLTGAFLCLLQGSTSGLVGLPALLLSLVILISGLDQSPLSKFAKPAQWVGDNTYGVYLWHIPIQIGLLLMIDTLALDRAIVSTPLFFFSFILMVVVVARISFLRIERPLRNTIRHHFG